MKLLIDIRDFKINAQVCTFSLADQNIGFCIEFTFLKGNLGRLYWLTFLKCSFSSLSHFERQSDSRFNSDENCF